MLPIILHHYKSVLPQQCGLWNGWQAGNNIINNNNNTNFCKVHNVSNNPGSEAPVIYKVIYMKSKVMYEK